MKNITIISLSGMTLAMAALYNIRDEVFIFYFTGPI